MKVLLINAGWGRAGKGRRRYKRAWPPLDLLNTAALLRKHDHDVKLMDLRADPAASSRLAEQCRESDLVIFQTTPLDRWQCPDLNIEQLPGMVKDLPRDKLVMAGVHGTLDPAGVIKLTNAKAIIRGEPENPILALADSNGNGENHAGIECMGVEGFQEDRLAPTLGFRRLAGSCL